MKKIIALMLAAMLLCFAGCGAEVPEETGSTTPVETTLSTEAAYCVTVADPLGEPWPAGIIVRFLQGGQQVAMQVTDASGVAQKILPKGDYTVELAFTDTETLYHYDTADLTLSADKTDLTVTLCYGAGESGSQLNDRPAYRIGTGCTYVPVAADGRTYYLFTPTQAGTYEFRLVSGEATLGYYGSPYFVQSESIEPAVDNCITVSVSAGMIGTSDTGTSVYVIGLDAAGAEGCILSVRRTGDPRWSAADEPWLIYQPTATLSPYTLPAGAVIREFDLSAPTGTYNLVFNAADGFYHLNSAEGPLVLARLGKPTAYLEAVEVILKEYSGMGKYFYDENGTFLKKESYTECLLTYCEYLDEEQGVYPLTEDLMYMLTQRGEYAGWWDPKGASFLFKDDQGIPLPNINLENAWLFLFCYLEN